MSKYIDIENLIANIKRKIESIENCPFQLASFGEGKKREGELIAYRDVLSIVDSLQQEQPEVDLEKEMDNEYDSPLWEGEHVSWMTYTRIARHFYELGLNTRKED